MQWRILHSYIVHILSYPTLDSPIKWCWYCGISRATFNGYIHSFVKQAERTFRKILVSRRNSLALTSLSWESLKGALLVSLKTISTFLKGTIRLYRKVVGIFLTLPKQWCHEIISYAIILVVCSAVYMPLAPGFCFRSLYFLPTTARADFHFKVILPSVTYGLVVWSSCGKSLFDEMEKIHVIIIIIIIIIINVI